MWRWVWVHVGAQRQPHVSLLYSLELCASLFLWDRVSYWPRSPQARWQDVQWAHRLLLLPFPQHWHYSYSLWCPDFFIWVLGTNCKSSCFKQILQWLSCPPVSTGPFRKIQDLFLKVLSLVTQSPFNNSPLPALPRWGLSFNTIWEGTPLSNPGQSLGNESMLSLEQSQLWACWNCNAFLCNHKSDPQSEAHAQGCWD